MSKKNRNRTNLPKIVQIVLDDSQWCWVVFGYLTAIVLRCGTGFHAYSGQAKPPMFGDYEAQRHWMEITYNLPIKEWYHNTSENDLQYWGLDYPPLTAYHSYICGVIANYIEPAYVTLRSSRGYESEDHKTFMRYTVLTADILLYMPAIVIYFIIITKVYPLNHKRNQNNFENLYISPQLALIMSLFYPGIILIDHGHFQYNCISLGFTILAVASLCSRNHILGSIFFCLALNYKQMELYYAIPFFMYLLSMCIPKPGQSYLIGFLSLFKIALSVLITFAIIWAPFLQSTDHMLQVVHRIFPVARGIFEDKVANFWCSLNVFYKFKNLTQLTMLRLCTFTTLIAVLPSAADLFLRPNIRKFVPALINSSLAFFLFSFHVHEKSILLVAIPVTLYLHIEPFVCFWCLIVSIFSMFPLFIKDGLVIACLALSIFYITTFKVIVQYSTEKHKTVSPFADISIRNILLDILRLQNREQLQELFNRLFNNKEIGFKAVQYITFIISLIGCVLLVIFTLIFEPPDKYPNLFDLLISVYSCIHFILFFLYFNIIQFKIPQAPEDARHVKLKIN